MRRLAVTAAAALFILHAGAGRAELAGDWAAKDFWPQEAVRDAQELLAYYGFYTSTVDGLFGPGTRRAIETAIEPIVDDAGIPWAELPTQLQVALIRNALRQYDAGRALNEMQEGRPSPVGPSDRAPPQGEFVLPEPATRGDIAVTQTYSFGPDNRCTLNETLSEGDGPQLQIEQVGRCVLSELQEEQELVLFRLIEGFRAEPEDLPNALRVLRLAEARAGAGIGLPSPHAFALDGDDVIIDGTRFVPMAAAGEAEDAAPEDATPEQGQDEPGPPTPGETAPETAEPPAQPTPEAGAPAQAPEVAQPSEPAAETPAPAQ